MSYFDVAVMLDFRPYHYKGPRTTGRISELLSLRYCWQHNQVLRAADAVCTEPVSSTELLPKQLALIKEREKLKQHPKSSSKVLATAWEWQVQGGCSSSQKSLQRPHSWSTLWLSITSLKHFDQTHSFRRACFPSPHHSYLQCQFLFVTFLYLM